MIQFAIALVVFLALHAVPAATGLRRRLIARLGRPLYIGLFSITSVAALAWLVWAALEAPHVPLWPSSRATALVPVIAMIPACVLLTMSVTRHNPLSVSFVGGGLDTARPGILALTRHPILWAFFLWAASHAIANGDLVALVMFGGFAVFSLAGMKLQERRARRLMTPEAFAAAMAVARGGLADRLTRAVSVRSGIEFAFGIVLYAALIHLHGPVIGIDPSAYF